MENQQSLWISDLPYLWHGIYHPYGYIEDLDKILDEHITKYRANKITYREWLLLVLKYIIEDKYLFSRKQQLENIEKFKNQKGYLKRKAIQLLNTNKQHLHSTDTVSLSCSNIEKYSDYLCENSFDQEPISYFAGGILLAFNDNVLHETNIVKRDEMDEYKGVMQNEIIIKERLSIDFLEGIFVDSYGECLLDDVLKLLERENLDIIVGCYKNESYYDTKIEYLGKSKSLKI